MTFICICCCCPKQCWPWPYFLGSHLDLANMEAIPLLEPIVAILIEMGEGFVFSFGSCKCLNLQFLFQEPVDNSLRLEKKLSRVITKGTSKSAVLRGTSERCPATHSLLSQTLSIPHRSWERWLWCLFSPLFSMCLSPVVHITIYMFIYYFTQNRYTVLVQ